VSIVYHYVPIKFIIAGELVPMYQNGQSLSSDHHFQDHIEASIPVQVYYQNLHKDIGFIDVYSPHFIKINNTFYNRTMHVFISRPGY